MKTLLYKFYDIFFPRFITEEVVIMYDEEGVGQLICRLEDVFEDEVFDGIVTVRSFNLFGYAIFPTMVGDVKPWKPKGE